MRLSSTRSDTNCGRATPAATATQYPQFPPDGLSMYSTCLPSCDQKGCVQHPPTVDCLGAGTRRLLANAPEGTCYEFDDSSSVPAVIAKASNPIKQRAFHQRVLGQGLRNAFSSLPPVTAGG